MATAYVDAKKEHALSDLTVVTAGGTVTNDVRVAYLDTLTPAEVAQTLQKIAEKIINTGKLA